MTKLAQPARTEFVALCALLMSTISMSVDFMLPALGELANDLGSASGNQRQWVIIALFLGLSVGVLIFGPLSDAFGRRPIILIGVAIFAAGSIVCATAQSYELFLFGRGLQGVGAAGPRIATIAMIRDRYVGVDMAQILSLVMGIFIIVPVIAPIIGQSLLLIMPWRGLFILLGVFCGLGGVWLMIRQPETLSKPAQISGIHFMRASREVLTNRRAVLATLASACTYGCLMGFINSSQQIFQDLYKTGDAYALWFGGTAVFISSATFVNARLVKRVSMTTICALALCAVAVQSLVFLGFLLFEPVPSIAVWMLFNCSVAFLMGLTFGNFNAIALQQLGHVAGLATSFIGSTNTLLGMAIAAVVGLNFNFTLIPVTAGYAICAALGSTLMFVAAMDASKS